MTSLSQGLLGSGVGGQGPVRTDPRPLAPDPCPRAGCLQAFVDELARTGVRHVCVSPGARSTPLAQAIAASSELRAWSHVDERSGAFFALGIAKATRSPVAVVCTSGTAAANFYPAIIEAAHSHVPLLALTADRPAELRDCGAPQAIDQIKLYGDRVKLFVDVGDAAAGESYFRSLACQAIAVARRKPAGPVHLNFPLREPLVDPSTSGNSSPLAGEPYTRAYDVETRPSEEALDEIAEVLAGSPRGLIVCGPRDAMPEESAAVVALAGAAQYPIVADPTSQLRCRAGRGWVVGGYDVFLREDTLASRLAPDLVVRVGPMPTSKAFGRYLQNHPRCRQIVIDPTRDWNDPLRTTTDLLCADPAFTCRMLADRARRRRVDRADGEDRWPTLWRALDREAHGSLATQIDTLDEMFEGKVFSELARRLADGTCLYVGNSMAIRDLEAFWPAAGPDVRFLCNRGANGIDGFVSSGLGAAAASSDRVVIVTGDLGFYHDSNGLLAAKRYGLRALIIVLNNDGGGIFSYLPQSDHGTVFDEHFLTSHGLDFRGIAETYGCDFRCVRSWSDFRSAVDAGLRSAGTTVVEVPIDRKRSVALHRQMWARAARAALEAV